MRNRNAFSIFALLVIIFISGCDKTDVITGPGNITAINSPAIANSAKSFAFNVIAKSYNSALEYPVSFNGLTLDLALSLSNYSSGDVSIQTFDENKQMLFKLDYNQNTNLTQFITLETAPTKMKLIFSNFTATFSFTLSAK